MPESKPPNVVGMRNKLDELKNKLIELEQPLQNEIYGTPEYFKRYDEYMNRIFLAERIRSEVAVLEWILGEKRTYRASWEVK